MYKDYKLLKHVYKFNERNLSIYTYINGEGFNLWIVGLL